MGNSNRKERKEGTEEEQEENGREEHIREDYRSKETSTD